MLHKSLLFLLLTATVSSGQECRLTPLSPAQPPIKVEEGERALESQTFQTTALALSPTNVVHFFDTASRIRRIEPTGRVTTLAGNGIRTDATTPGRALDNGLPAVSQMVFSPQGVLHFVAAGRVMRVVNGNIEAVAGSGRPGFNGEALPALEANLGGIVNVAFDQNGALLIVDGFNRVRRLDTDGFVRTVAGSARAAATAGLTGDNGAATLAALSNPRQVTPLRDGSFWIKDLGGRHLRIVTPDGIIRTINTNFETSVNILLFPDGTPAAATANRVYRILSNGNIETGGNSFTPFTGTPLAIGTDSSLYFSGNARPEQRNPLLKLTGNIQTVVAGAPVAPTVEGQAPPYGIWNLKTGSLLYSASVGEKSGVVEVKPGQQPKLIAGGGEDVGDPDGKDATKIAIFGIVAFSVDGEGRIVVADVVRRRILVIGTDSKVTVLKAGGEAVVFAPVGTFNSLQRIQTDNAGNIYWFQQGATPLLGVFTATIAVWTRSSSTLSAVEVVGLAQIAKLEDGSVAVIAGNGANFRSVLPMTPSGLGEAQPALRLLPLASVSRFRETPYFVAASRLFRGDQGSIAMLDLVGFTPDFVVASRDALIVHQTDGGFYQISNPEFCTWMPQPVISSVANAASYDYPDTVSARGLITLFGTGLGPAGGQGLVLDGVLRAGAQPAPYPAITLGNYSGANPVSTLTGTSLPVIYSDNRQVTVQAVTSTGATASYLIFYTWQGLQLMYPATVRAGAATPGLFTSDGTQALAVNEDGSRNGTGSAAEAGSLIQLLGTGFGATDVNLALGEFTGTAPVRTTGTVTVTIGEVDAEVEFAGGYPGTIGVYQLRVRVPEGLEQGPHPVRVTMSNQISEPRQQATIQVR